ncbi:MAG: hypothetical protein A2Y34_17370 [Spirochaetes bacterium GWC1_27_15]|nr:MAG: hypothetical protein A2Z98_15060 [Spirochaetes bacterium GWB1_27_13]OHD20660.1 MAG: hypothetical protein A2Y34_17370 [Spirochaetes bacterium GWC1_27_15]
MKKILFIAIYLNILIILLPETTNLDNKSLKDRKNYLDISFLTGYTNKTYSLSSVIYSGYEELYRIQGLHVGIEIGYQRLFTNFYAFGGSISFIMPIIGNVNISNKQTGSVLYNRFESIELLSTTTGATLNLNFIFGDLVNKKIAFIFDIGGGLLFRVMAGIYIKGFIFKAGYHLTVDLNTISSYQDSTPVFVHHLCFSIGVKINWKE